MLSGNRFRFSGRCARASAWARIEERADAADPAIWRICPLLASCTSNAEAFRIVTRHVWPWRRLGCFTIVNAARVFCRGFPETATGGSVLRWTRALAPDAG
ncbi:hypothetical protein GFM14_21890 [Rhizobium leguminosarum bv. viciae]|nr:hypothetical protein [Rhizobium leguminosarum bv. viciae]TBZ62775.1 hypothetical protein E0H64_29070 [Rhizobium leguminosarum bv. viciae]